MKTNTIDNENELITHYVVVDEYATIQLKIPKQLSAMELKGLMMKADKIFRLSDIGGSVGGPAQSASSSGKLPRNRVMWSDEMDALVKNNIGKMSVQEMLERLKAYNPKMTIAAIYGRNERLRDGRVKSSTGIPQKLPTESELKESEEMRGVAARGTIRKEKIQPKRNKWVTWTDEMNKYFLANFKTKDVRDMLVDLQRMEPRIRKKHVEYKKYYILSKGGN